MQLIFNEIKKKYYTLAGYKKIPLNLDGIFCRMILLGGGATNLLKFESMFPNLVQSIFLKEQHKLRLA